jgi:Glycosyl hydrolases family 2, sugar binding domain
MNRTKREQTSSMRMAIKAFTSFIGLLAAIGSPAQTRVIDQNWQFSPDPKAQFTAATVGRAATWRAAKASLSWNAQYDDLRDYAGVGWYRVNVVLPTPQASKRELIHFGAVDYLTRVWVNGHLLGEHEGGYTPFTFELTGKVHAGNNEILVRVFDPPMPQPLLTPIPNTAPPERSVSPQAGKKCGSASARAAVGVQRNPPRKAELVRADQRTLAAGHA